MNSNHLKSMNEALSILPFTVPTDILNQIFNDNKKIQKEVISGGINDTQEREMLLQLVLKQLNLPDFPFHGMNDNKWPDFLTKLRSVAPNFSIDMTSVEIEEQKRLDSLKPIHNVQAINDLKDKVFDF